MYTTKGRVDDATLISLFDNNPSLRKIAIDDTVKLICCFESAHNVNKHTEYIIRVQRGPCKDNKWTVSRRYSDFVALQSSLQQAGIELLLPPKKIFGNMQPSFIAERQVALQNYINDVLKHNILALSLQVRNFLDPNNYSSNLAEQALQTVSIALRGDGRYELKGMMADIGWRIRKHYFLVQDTESKTDCMLSWQTYGPDRSLSDKDLQSAFKSLRSLSHPFIGEILGLHNLEMGAYVVRKIYENGTLRDMLYGTDYTKSYLSKYGNPKVRKPLTYDQISHYGFQILQALIFLHEHGLAHGNLHPGNIAIDNQRAVLLDIENIFLGGPSLHRPYLIQLKRVTSPEQVDIYSFGKTLYEMVFAAPLEGCCYYDMCPGTLNKYLESVICLCLNSSIQHECVSLKQLLCCPVFYTAHFNDQLQLHAKDYSKGRFKFPYTLKTETRTAMAYIEARLNNEQKLERSARKEVRIQEILNSEEEMKKQRRRAKKRDNIWKSTSSLAETVRSQSASTASSPTPPVNSADTSVVGVSPPAASSCDARSALLGAICSFDKTTLSRVTSP